MLRRIGTVVTMAGMAILASPLLAMAQEAAGPRVRVRRFAQA